jgi:hypothetical protein
MLTRKTASRVSQGQRRRGDAMPPFFGRAVSGLSASRAAQRASAAKAPEKNACDKLHAYFNMRSFKRSLLGVLLFSYTAGARPAAAVCCDRLLIMSRAQ